jgi:hypothetical protein
MSDEEAIFEVWFQIQRKKDWELRYPNEPFHTNWGLGFRGAMLKGWLARASLHVTPSTPPETGTSHD